MINWDLDFKIIYMTKKEWGIDEQFGILMDIG